MNDIWSRSEIESPCIKICVMDERSKLCIGCGRTRQEIAAWSQLSSKKRHSITQELPERMLAHKPKRRGGRTAREI